MAGGRSLRAGSQLRVAQLSANVRALHPLLPKLYDWLSQRSGISS